jgi:hypothetical protein
MKKLLIIFTIAAVFYACKKQELITYNADNNIYFANMHITTRIDSLDLSFAYSPATVTDSTVYLQVEATGTSRKTDREFAITVDPSSTAQAGTDYVLPDKFILHAGNQKDSFPVKLLRTPALQTNKLSLRLNLSPNNNFHTDIKAITGLLDSINALSFKINMSDVLTSGNYWSGVFQPYFGVFSIKKLKLINQVTGMPLDYVNTGIYDLNLSARCANWAITMSRYLKDQAQAGTPVYEDDGVTLMTMGTSYQ